MAEERKEMQSEQKQTTQVNGSAETKKRRSAISIMGSLIGLVKPLIHIMLAAIVLGTLGYLCAIFLTILAGQVIVHGLLTGVAGMNVPVDNMWLVFTPVKTILIVMVVIAVLRGLLHYVEQYCNHLSHLNCWQSSVTKYLRHFGNSVRQNWKEGTKET